MLRFVPLTRTALFVRIGCSALLVAASALSASADEVARKSSKVPTSGQVLRGTKTEVVVKPTTGAEIVVPIGDVRSIKWDGEDLKLNLARSAENAGQLDKALAEYQRILGEKKTGSNLLAPYDLQFLIARAQAKLAQSDPAKAAAALRGLEQIRTSQPDGFRLYETLSLLGDLHARQKEYDKARAVYDEMAKASVPEIQMTARIASARVLLTENKPADALTAFEAVLGQPAKTPAETARRLEAQLGKASCLIQQGKHADAVVSLDEVLKEVSPDEARIQAEAYLRQGDCFLAQGKTQDALLAYLHVDVLFPGESSLRAEALFRLVSLWPQVQQPERAAEAKTILQTDYPASEWTKKLAGG